MTIPASMPISVTYLGDGAAVNFPVPFMYFENADGTKQLSVIVADDTGENEKKLVENTDFTLTDAGKPNGTLTMKTPLAKDKKLTIVYNIPIEQPIDWEEFARLPSESIERSFDKIVALLKQHQEIINRCVKVVVSSNQTPQELLEEVYTKLDSATEIAADAITAAQNANTAADNATAAVAQAEGTLADVNNYVDAGKLDIAKTVDDAKNSIEQTITAAVVDVKEQAVTAAQEAIDGATVTVTQAAKNNLDAYVDGSVEPSLQSFVDAAQAQAGNASSSASTAAQTLSDVQATAAQFDTNYNNKLAIFNQNAADKTTAFNSNAADKTAEFNENAALKQSLIDASATAAQTAATAASTSKNAASVSQTEAKQSELKAAAYAERVRSEGIPMSIIEQRRIEKTAGQVKLWWQDPRDTIIDGFVLSSWKSTTVVKKQGSYPQDVGDGIVVEIVTQHNKYADVPLVDTQANAENWYYRAFPLSVNGVYSLDKRNNFGVVLYGYRINEVDPVPSTRVEYLQYCDNAFYDPCVMDFVSDIFNWGSWKRAFFIPKPCALTYAGNVDYYLNPDNFTLKEDGSASDVSNSAYGGNFMCEFPAIFVKVFKENNYINVLVSNVKLDDGFECWSCKKADGSYSPNFYLPMFEGTNIDNKLRSIATNGKPTGSTNAETEATLAMANGTGWNTTLWADEMLMMLLYPLLFKSTDSQSTLGAGATGSTSGFTCNNNAAVTRGLMYGTKDRSAAGMTFLGLHNWHGHRWRRPNGLMNDKGNIKVKMTHSTVDGSTVTGFNRTGEGYISTGFVPPAASESYINRYEPLVGGKYGIVPKAVSGSSTTYYCDAMWTNNGQLDQLIMCGSVYIGTVSGAFCFAVHDLPTHTVWDLGASPSYRHL